MKMSNKTYDFLKWTLLVFEPALITFIGGLGVAFEWDASLVITLIGLVSTFLGSITGISNLKYKKGE